MATDPLDELLAALALVRLDDDGYEGWAVERARRRIFGGEVLAQIIVAAARSVEGRACHSLHVHFLAPGQPTAPLEHRVRRVRDGRRFAQRQVTVFQHGREIALATVSFASGEPETPGYQHEPMPAVDGPESLATELELRQKVAHRMAPEDRAWLLMPRAVEVRPVHPVPLFDPPPVPPLAQTWIRTTAPLPHDPALHWALLAYASDTTLLDVACYPHGVSWIDPRVQQASLDHAMWFHRPFRIDDWLLYAQVVPTAARGRALGHGRVFTRDGVLVASVVQEGVAQVTG